ncbi:NAD-dependent epimerase/dehydratase family protein [Ferrimonas pelagia]
MRAVLVAGATGATGSALVNQLLADDHYDVVHLLSRRTTHWRDHEKVIEHILPLSRIVDLTVRSPIAEIYCCLGTTLKKAGSQAAFRAVDLDAVVALGRWGKNHGVETMHAISSIGADPTSRSFYLRTKGEMEQALSAFGLPGLYLYRPSVLVGERGERRVREGIGARVLTAFDWLPGSDSWSPIPVKQLASLMHTLGRENRPGRHRIGSGQIQRHERSERDITATSNG